MTTRRSSFDLGRVRPFIRNLLHRSRGLIILYSALLFFALPVPFAVTVYNCHERWVSLPWRGMTWLQTIENATAGASHLYNLFSCVFFTALAASLPLILSVTLLGYMHDRRAVDVYHSLPLTRQELFLSSSIAAALIMWVPLAAAFALTGAIAALVPGMSLLFVLKDLFFWAAAMLAVYALAAFCATQVGTVQDQLLFTLVVSASLSGVGVLLNVIAQDHLYGYTVSDSFFNLIYRLCPFSLMIGRYLAGTAPYYHDSNVGAIVWLLVSVLLLLASARLYAKRKSEQAEVLGNIGPLQLYVRLIGTIVGGICAGFLIGNLLDVSSSSRLLLPCIAAGALLVYPIGDAVLARRVRPVKKILPVWLASVAAAAAICACVVFDPTGYVERIPDPAQIESVEVNGFETRYASQSERGDELTLREPESVAAVLAAHRAQVENRDYYDGHFYGMNLNLTYHLRNGRTMQRSYGLLAPETLEVLRGLETNDEVLLQTAAIYSMKAERITRVTVIDSVDGAAAEPKLSAEQTAALLEALRADLLAQPQSDLEAGEPVAVVRLQTVYDRPMAQKATMPEEPDGVSYIDYDYQLTKGFTRTLAVLNRLPEVRAAAIGDTSLERVTQVSLWLNPDGLRYWSRLFISSGAVDNAADIIYYYRDSADHPDVTVPFFTVSKEEFAALGLSPRAYCATGEEEFPQTVEVLYYDGDPRTKDPCGVAFVSLADLPEQRQREMIERYRVYSGDGEAYPDSFALTIA